MGGIDGSIHGKDAYLRQKLSMLFNLLSVGEASRVILGMGKPGWVKNS
jgi:hypothetical protein